MQKERYVLSDQQLKEVDVDQAYPNMEKCAMACSCLKVYAGIVATLGLKETREREKKRLKT